VSGTPDFLGLPNLRTTSVVYGHETIEVEAETVEPVFHCCTIQRLGKWGDAGRRMINDTHHGGLPVLIKLRVRRAQCYECGTRGIREHFTFIQPKRHMTRRLADYIAKQTVLVGDTSSAAGRHVYVSASSARRITNAYIDRHIDRLERPTPRVLGIDEKYLGRIFRAVVGNVEERTVLNMLPDRDKSLEAFIRDLPDADKVEVVCIDQYDPYRTMIKKLLPGRAIVTDHFHVVRKANDALDRIRRGMVSTLKDEDKRTATRLRMSQKLFYCRSHDLRDEWRRSIIKWEQRFPVLGKAYWAKERFYDMYRECSTPAEAEAYYKRWKRTLEPDIADHFNNVANIQQRWLPHVFAYFEHPFTTAYVESLNRGLKALAAEGRRYSFETIRGKLLLAEKLEKKTFRDRSPGASARGDTTPLETFNWGIDIAAMNRMLEAEEIHYQQTERGYRMVRERKGLSTVEPVLDEAA